MNELSEFFFNENKQLLKRLGMLEAKAAELDRAFLALQSQDLPQVDMTFRDQQILNHALREKLGKIAAKIQADSDYLDCRQKQLKK